MRREIIYYRQLILLHIAWAENQPEKIKRSHVIVVVEVGVNPDLHQLVLIVVVNINISNNTNDCIVLLEYIGLLPVTPTHRSLISHHRQFRTVGQ